ESGGAAGNTERRARARWRVRCELTDGHAEPFTTLAAELVHRRIWRLTRRASADPRGNRNHGCVEQPIQSFGVSRGENFNRLAHRSSPPSSRRNASTVPNVTS